MRTLARYRTIQFICWTGVVADALWAVALGYPPLYGYLTAESLGQPELSLRLAMGVGASLMAGWTVLLAWTALKPIERRAVMLFTALPTILGLSIVTVIGLANDHTANLWILAKCGVLFVAMLIGFQLARSIAKESVSKGGVSKGGVSKGDGLQGRFDEIDH